MKLLTIHDVHTQSHLGFPLYYFLNIGGSSSYNDVIKMEGCPRSLMLNVDLKETFPTEFTPSLKTVKKEKRIDFIYSQIA